MLKGSFFKKYIYPPFISWFHHCPVWEKSRDTMAWTSVLYFLVNNGFILCVALLYCNGEENPTDKRLNWWPERRHCFCQREKGSGASIALCMSLKRSIPQRPSDSFLLINFKTSQYCLSKKMSFREGSRQEKVSTNSNNCLFLMKPLGIEEDIFLLSGKLSIILFYSMMKQRKNGSSQYRSYGGEDNLLGWGAW